MKRKDFLKLSSASVFLAGLKSHGINPSDLNLNYNYSENNSQYMGDFIAPKLEVVKVAFIGVGARGIGHAKQIATIEGTEVVAISDLHQDLAKKSSGKNITFLTFNDFTIFTALADVQQTSVSALTSADVFT